MTHYGKEALQMFAMISSAGNKPSPQSRLSWATTGPAQCPQGDRRCLLSRSTACPPGRAERCSWKPGVGPATVAEASGRKTMWTVCSEDHVHLPLPLGAHVHQHNPSPENSADGSPLRGRSALLLSKRKDKYDTFGGFLRTQESRCLPTPP